jgi:hypothetical protein
MKKQVCAVFILISVIWIVAACNTGPTPTSTPTPTPKAALWKGIYTENFENSLFRPCAGAEWSPSEPVWAAVGNLEKITAVADKLNDFIPVYVEFTGEIDPPGSYGNLGALSTQINIKDVSKVQKEIPKECH